MKNNIQYSSTRHTTYSCKYHIVWTTKYRVKFLNNKIQKLLKELFYKISKENNFEIIELEIMKDHIHILIELSPVKNLKQIINLLKGKSSFILRNKFEYLKNYPNLWTKSYFVSKVGGAPLSIVKQYIEDQIGYQLIKKHREAAGEIVNCTIKCTKSGKYFVSICAKQNLKIQKHKKGKIGIDLGLKCFCMTSNENQIGNPKFLLKAQKQLKHQQRKLSRMQHDSNNYLKQCKIIGNRFDKVCNCRNDFQWKLANEFAKNNSTICIENLQIKNMIKNHCLAQRISDVTWNSFILKLIWECKKHNTKLYTVDTFYPSSQTCSECGYVNKEVKDLKVREWICPQCGATLERDFNAAKNILKEGLRTKISLIDKPSKKKLSILKKKKNK